MYNISEVNQDTLNLVVSILKQNNLPAEDITDKTRLFHLKENEEIVGTVGIEFYNQYALLRSLAVDNEKRNKGLGKKLVEFVEQYAKQEGVKELILLTTTAPAFFKSRNYQVIDRVDVPEDVKKSSEFASVCPSSAIVMKKILK
jgi:amino-acid N-acetyltransferase